MAGSWAKSLAVAVLMMSAGAAGFTQPARTQLIEDGSIGSLSGKVTDLHFKPLEGVAVVIRN